METTKEIKKIITDNKSDIAFIIGNGIHRHKNENALAWDKLLIDLWNITQPNEMDSIPSGISYTEFYDVLEMNCKTISDGKLQDFRSLSTTKLSEDVKKQINSEVLYQNISSTLKGHVLQLTKEAPRLKINWEKIYTYFEKQNAVYGLQIYISSIMKRWKSRPFQTFIIKKIEQLNAPLLTTNYDNVLGSIESIDLRKLGAKKITDYYPWTSYYSNKELTNPLSGFGIWHINGMVNYHRSISLGLSQYMSLVSRARNMIQSSKGGKELFQGKNTPNWIGKDTWLHIIFNKSLFIFGIALEENETFLRWLLLQRANYFNKFPNRKYEGWYLTRKEDIDKSPGKRFFLKNVGIKILEVEDYKTIYEDIWQ